MPFLLPAAASAVAAAAPAAAAAGASAAATAGIGATLTSIAGNVLMNVAISAAMSIFQPQVGVAGRTFEWTLDPDGPIPFAAGRIGVPGSAVYRKTFGPDLMYYGIPSVLSGAGPIDGFEGFMADDETVTFDGSGKAVSSQYAGELWYKTSQGAQPDTAITSPTGLKNGATLPGWTSAHKLSGKASYMIVMGENSKGTAFPTGEIKPLITLRGLLVYDPRKDSTYPGGSGEHRLSNPLTWEYSANPILWALKWTLGLWEGPNGKGAPQVDYQVGGIGAKLSGIDVPAFVAAANVADANGWTCAAYPTTDDDKHQVLTGFLQAGGAIYAQRAGKISCIQRAAPRTSIVTVSAYDTAGPLEIDTAASRIDRINTLRPRFWSEPHRWQMTALDQEVTAQVYRDEDGGVRPAGIDYPYVTDGVQAAQLAALQIANTREGIAGVIPLKPHLQRIRPGDAFTITEAGFVLNGLKCLCLNTDYDPATGVVRVSFVSETDAKYPFALGQNPTPPTPQVLTPVDPRFVSPPDAGDWTVTPRPPSQGGTQQPGFDLTGFVSNSTATAIIVETGPSANGPWTQAYQGPPTVTNIPIDGLQPGATYFIAIQYQRNQNYSEREVFGPFTAPDLVAGDVSPTAPTIVAMQDAIDLAEEGLGSINSAVASLNATIYTAGTGLLARSDAMFADINTATTGLKAQTASLLASLNTPTTGVLARLTATEGQVATNNSAAVNRLTALEATVYTSGTGLSARLATAESAIVTNRDAAAQRLNVLEATVDTPGTGLSARLSVAESAVTSLSENKADASRVEFLEARADTRPNQIPNSTAAAGLVGWTGAYGARPPEAFSDASEGPTFGLSFDSAVSGQTGGRFQVARFKADPQVAYSFQAELSAYLLAAGSVRAFVTYENAAGASLDTQTVSALPGGYVRRVSENFMSPPGAVRATVNIDYFNATFSAGGYAGWRRLKLERGSVCTAWSDEASDRTTAASVATLTTATADLQAGKADAARVTSLEAIVNTPGTGVSARLATAESAIVTNRDAAAQRLSALEATVGSADTGLSARVAGLQTAVSELDSGKANASDLASLQAEVVSARGGASSLNVRLNTVESTLDGKASAASVAALSAIVNAPGTGLAARTGALETVTSDLQSQKADASRVQYLEARADTRPNQIPNPTAAAGLVGWTGAYGARPPEAYPNSGASPTFGLSFDSAASGLTGGRYQTARFSVDANAPYSFQAELSAYLITAGSVRAYATYEDAAGNALTTHGVSASVSGGYVRLTSENVVTPAGTVRATVNIDYFNAAFSAGGYAGWRRLKLERGTVCTAWSDEASDRTTAASVATLTTATADLQAGKADATRVTSLEAIVNTPGTGVSARLTNVESVAASADGKARAIKGVVTDVNGYIAGYSSTNDGESAAFEVLADVFGIRSPGGGERTEYRGGRWYIYSPDEATRTIYGKAFGGSQKITWWTGPDTVAEGSETKGNAYVYISQNTVGGPRFGGSDVQGPGGVLTATANTGFIGGARNGAGYVNTSNQVTVTVSGGTAGATIRWVRISGDSRIQMNDAAAFNTGAYATIGVGEVITAYFMGAVTKGGQSTVVYVQVDLSDNGT